MYCSKCGSEGDGKFCPNCGAPFAGNAPEAPTAESAPSKGNAPVKRKKPLYKRVWFWLLIGVVLLILWIGRCGAAKGTPTAVQPATAQAAAQQPTEATEAQPAQAQPSATQAVQTEEPAEITLAEQVIFEQDGVRITAKGLDTDGSLFGPALKLLIENDSDRSIGVQARNVSVNDLMVGCAFSGEVAPGKKSNEEVTFLDSDIKAANITVFQKIEFTLHLFDPDSWDSILDSDPIVLTTSADPAYVQPVDDSGFTAMEQDGVKVVVKKLDSADSFWGADVYLYIENSSQKDVTVQVRDVSINGFMVDPLFSCEVPAGKKAFDAITFLQSDLADNGITDITALELSFHVSDMKTWKTIYETDTVQITF